MKKPLTILLGLLMLSGPAAAQRFGLYPLETKDETLALAIPTAISRALQTVDGAILPAPIDLFQAVKTRPAFEAQLTDVFSLDSLITGKLEGSAGNYTVTYTIKSGANSQTVTAKGADFSKLVIASDAALLSALGLKPSATDNAERSSIEKALPTADVVTASAVPYETSSASVLEKAGDNAWALDARAVTLLQSAKQADALPLAAKALQLAPQDPYTAFIVAAVQLANAKIPEAKTAIDAGMKLNPAIPELHYLQGRYLLRSVSPLTASVAKDALAALERALQYNPRFLEAAVIAADLYERLGDANSAFDVLASQVARMPDEPALHNRVLDLLLSNDRDQATSYLQQVIKAYPDVPDDVYALAARLFNTDAAVKLVASGETRYPQSAPLANARGNLLERQTQYEDAAKAYKQALERDAKLQRAGLSLAGALSKLGRFDEAEAAIQQTFGRVDQKLLARMYLQTGRYDRAKTVLDKLASSAATDADVPYYQGILALRLYQADDAKKAFEASIKLKPDNTQVKVTLTEIADVQRLGAPKLSGDALYQLQLAQALLDSGSALEAQTVLVNALKTNPNDLHLNFYYGYDLLQVGDPDDAVDQLQATLKLAPSNVVVMSFLALGYIGNGRLDLALDTANAAIAKDAKYARAYYVLGYTNFQLGNATATRDALLKAVGVDANFRVLVDPLLNALPK